MIGGRDILIEIPAGAAAIDFALRAIRFYWPLAVFEDANADAPAVEYASLDFSKLFEVMAYKSQNAWQSWEKLGADPSLDGTMIHLIASGNNLTVVVDNQPSPEVLTIVETIRTGLKKAAHRIRLKEAA
jgi:hypothetical protein